MIWEGDIGPNSREGQLGEALSNLHTIQMKSKNDLKLQLLDLFWENFVKS